MIRLVPMFLLAITLSTACAPSRPMPVLVEVADSRSGQPLADVVVRVSGGTFYVPTMQASTLGAPGAAFGPPPNPEGAVGSTDLLGQLHLTIPGQRPVYFHFFKTGYPEGYLVLETGESQVIGALAWTMGSTTPGIDRTLPLMGSPDSSRPGPHPKMMYRVAAATNIMADPFAQD